MDDCCNMPRLRPEYLTKDKPAPVGAAAAGFGSIDFISEGSHIYGASFLPDGSYPAPRPCVILIHGFPGTARNDDLAQALRRIGCVVLVPHHRGAWGSEGKYLISNCVQDAVNLANYVHSSECCKEMNIDPESIFLCGHSMGGNTSLQAAGQLPWLGGVILMTPYDPSRFLLTGRGEEFRALLEDGRILHSDGLDAIYADADAHKEEYCFATAYERIKDQNLLVIGGTLDDIAPPSEMVDPLWEKVQSTSSKALQRRQDLRCDHCMSDARFALAETVAQFIADVLNR